MAQDTRCPYCGFENRPGRSICWKCQRAIPAMPTPAARPAPTPQPPPDGALMVAGGIGGQIELYRDFVRIRRKGTLAFLTHGLKGEKDIPIAQITSIQLRTPGTVTSGYIQFTIPGGNESRGGIWDATQDENSVFFDSKQAPTFAAIRDAIQRRMDEYRQGTSGPSSGISDLEKLAELRDRGIITADEFAAKKRQLLGI